jgi:hypothetical protein
VLVAFGLNLTAEQVGTIMAFVTAVGGLISILIVRPRVTPVADPRDNEGRRVPGRVAAGRSVVCAPLRHRLSASALDASPQGCVQSVSTDAAKGGGNRRESGGGLARKPKC